MDYNENEKKKILAFFKQDEKSFVGKSDQMMNLFRKLTTNTCKQKQ